jgi:hypothetical protein
MPHAARQYRQKVCTVRASDDVAMVGRVVMVASCRSESAPHR